MIALESPTFKHQSLKFLIKIIFAVDPEHSVLISL